MSTTQGDIERGIAHGTSSRVLLEDINKMNQRLNSLPQVIPGEAKKQLVELAEKVAQRDKKKK